jgi:DHA1 family multidrug resistance protein-like MFS transporter
MIGPLLGGFLSGIVSIPFTFVLTGILLILNAGNVIRERRTGTVQTAKGA